MMGEVPWWIRRLAFILVLAHGALVMTLVGRPDACTDVWSWDHDRGGCCAMSAYTRWTKEGGDCCDYGSVDDRDAGAFASTPTVGPSPVVAILSPEPVLAPAEARRIRPDGSIPERPPDRAIRTTILLI